MHRAIDVLTTPHRVAAGLAKGCRFTAAVMVTFRVNTIDVHDGIVVLTAPSSLPAGLTKRRRFTAPNTVAFRGIDILINGSVGSIRAAKNRRFPHAADRAECPPLVAPFEATIN